MKQLITFSLTALLSVGLNAQSIDKKLAQHRVYVESMMQNQGKQVDKTKAPVHMESLYAQATWDTTRSKTDSVNLSYKGLDTAEYDYNMMIYPYNYPYATSPMFNNNLGTFTIPKVWFNVDNHWTVDPNTLVYGFYQRDSRGFDYSKNLLVDTSLYADSSIIPNMIYTNTYNGNNTIKASYSAVWQGGVRDSLYKQYFSYSSGYLKEDSIYEFANAAWHLISKTYYTYDVSNNLVQIDNYANPTDTTFTKPLTEQYQFVNSFDGSHRMLSTYEKQNDGVKLAPYVTDTFAYTGSYTYHTSWKEYQYDIIHAYWAPQTYMYKHVNINGLPDTIHIDAFDSISNKWVYYTKQLVKYDSLKNPDTLYSYQFNYVKFPTKATFTTKYYYKYITDPNAVNTIVNNSKIIIYPNPAHSNVTISGLTNAGDIAAAIYDMQGRLCSKQNLTANSGQAHLNTENLTVGTYLLTITDASGVILHRQLVIKQ